MKITECDELSSEIEVLNTQIKKIANKKYITDSSNNFDQLEEIENKGN